MRSSRKRILNGSAKTVPLFMLLLCSVLTILIAPRDINSHEPITTKVMFNKEIVRIFQRHCLACHGTSSTTNISLATYNLARPWAKAFKEEVLERRMPPYQAVKGFGRFHSDYTLTQHEIDQIVSWVEGGAPKGDDKDLPTESTTLSGWALGTPDLILEPKREINVQAGEGDDYRCIKLPTNLKETRWVTAVDFDPGNGAAVHCASFGIEPLDMDESGDHSGDCAAHNGMARDWSSLGMWMPGQIVTRLPNNVARLLPAGSGIVLRIHYHKHKEAMTVRSSLALYFGKGPAMRPLRTITLAAPEKDIPAGAELFRVNASYTMQDDAEAVSIRPLLFPFAKSVEVTAHRPDGRIDALIWVRDYRYDWQPEYLFEKPVSLPRGTRIEITAYLDNSDSNPNNPNNPAKAVHFSSAVCQLSFINGQRRSK